MYVNYLVHMTKMAAMPIYGKNPSKIFFSESGGPISKKLGLKHQWLKYYNVFIPPAKRSFRGVYCFQSVRISVIPSFRDSVNILTSLLNNLSSFCPMFFKFSTHLHHKTTHVWYEFRGQRVSFARVMGLFKPIHRMFAIVLIVHTL